MLVVVVVAAAAAFAAAVAAAAAAAAYAIFVRDLAVAIKVPVLRMQRYQIFSPFKSGWGRNNFTRIACSEKFRFSHLYYLLSCSNSSVPPPSHTHTHKHKTPPPPPLSPHNHFSHKKWHVPRTRLVEVLLNVHTNRRFIRHRSPGRPPRLSHSSWALMWMYLQWSLCTLYFSQPVLVLERSRQENEARVGWVIRQIQIGVVVWDH